jgi:hypothetical protein
MPPGDVFLIVGDSRAAGRHGDPWPLLAAHVRDAGHTATFLNTAKGSTDVFGAGSDQWAKPNRAYMHMVRTARAHGRPITAVIALLGPNAIVNPVTPTREGYRRALDTFAANIARDLPGAPPLVIDLCGEVGTGTPPDRPLAIANVHGAILDAARDNPRIWIGADLRDQTYADRVHPQTAAELRVVANRTWAALAARLYRQHHGITSVVENAKFE